MTFFSTRNTISIAFIAAALSFPAKAHSYDLGPVKIHGFASQGYILSSSNNINAKDTTNGGSFDFNELAINATYQLSQSIILSGQIGSRKLGDEGDNDLYVDYLQADIQFTDWFGTRLGRFKVPLGFYNQTRDIDLARPTVFLPQSIYPEAYRPFSASSTGGLVYGNLHFDALGDFDYEFFGGQGAEDDDSCLVQSLEVMVNGRDMSMDADVVYGGSLQFSPTIDGLRFGVTVTDGEATFKYTENISNTPATLEGTFEPITILSAEYAFDDFTFVSEYMYARQRSTYSTVSGYMNYEDLLTKPEGFYISGAYRFTEKFETAIYWEQFYSDTDDRNGDDKVALDPRAQKHQAWHKAWTLALRYDITDWWLVKAEGRLIDGTALTSPHYNEVQDLDRHWESLNLKTTFYF